MQLTALILALLTSNVYASNSPTVLACQRPGGTKQHCHLIREAAPNIYVNCAGKASWVNENNCMYLNVPTPEEAAARSKGTTSATY